MKKPSPYRGGVGVVEYHMRTKLFRQLTEEQATSLWQECKLALQARGLQDTVDECEQSSTGSLDTLPRGDVLDVLARLLTGQDWPLNMAPPSESDAFIDKLKAAILQRGYARAEELSA